MHGNIFPFGAESSTLHAMAIFSSTTGKRDGDDDDQKSGSAQDPLQGTNTGVESGDYSSPPDTPIPGKDDHPDSSRM